MKKEKLRVFQMKYYNCYDDRTATTREYDGRVMWVNIDYSDADDENEQLLLITKRMLL